MALILVVDRTEADRALLRTMLAHEGHDVYVAADGDEAIAVCSGSPVDIVMTGLQMPGMHGFELISLVRDISPRPTIVAVSGTGETQLDVAGALGADHTLAKPIDHRRLRDVLGSVPPPSPAAEER